VYDYDLHSRKLINLSFSFFTAEPLELKFDGVDILFLLASLLNLKGLFVFCFVFLFVICLFVFLITLILY
jgi:hypothetical protein